MLFLLKEEKKKKKREQEKKFYLLRYSVYFKQKSTASTSVIKLREI